MFAAGAAAAASVVRSRFLVLSLFSTNSCLPAAGLPAPYFETASEVFLHWGLTPTILANVFSRRPSLAKIAPDRLHSKLSLLHCIMPSLLTPSLLAGMLRRNTSFLSYRFDPFSISSLVSYLCTDLFPSPSPSSPSPLLIRAVALNPHLLLYPVDDVVRPCVHLYSSLGVDPPDLGRLLCCHPTIIRRSSITPEKLDLIRRTNLTPGDAMYKYALSFLAISRLDTIHAKLATYEKFGFSQDQTLSGIFAKSPNTLSLSIEKIQRNLTYIVGTVKLPAEVAFKKPVLLCCNLDKVLRPRHLVLEKLKDMGLAPDGMNSNNIAPIVRMTESRFSHLYITSRPEDVAEELTQLYESTKGTKRLAESSRLTRHAGFPIY